MDDLVVLKDVTKEYHGVPAVSEVNFSVRRGEVHAVLGENGAGKSTLMKMLSGVTAPTHGEIIVDGKPVRIGSPSEAQALGIVMVFQETTLVPSMTVGQNLFLGAEKTFNSLRKLYIAAQQFLFSLNFDVDPWALVSTLGAAKKQMVEIGRAVRQNANLIIFDEPTASLTPEEKTHFFSLVERLKKRGVSVVFISHALEEALAISDRITVLRDGKHVITDDTANFDRDRIIRSMVGRTLSNELYAKDNSQRVPRKPGKKILSVKNLSMGKMVRNTSLSVFESQVTGIFGLIGSGRTETAKILSGVLKRNFFYGGEVELEGRSVRYRTPQPAVRDGIAYVTEDRKIEGFFETMSIAENLQIGALAALSKPNRFLRMEEVRQLYQHWKSSLNIKAISEKSKVVELSGGNQQKVVIAKSLLQKPKIIIFDEPTRGVDVGAIAEIHQLINNLADEGIAVVVISSYLPEILALSNRILVARQGRIVEEFSPSEATEDIVMYAAVH